jgi:hypothetical protein
MTAAPALSLPGGRVILGWWRDCSGLLPHRLWFAHVLLHRVEVLVEVVLPAPLAGLRRSLLALLARRPAPLDRDSLAGELHLEEGLLAELLQGLAREGLVRPAAGSNGCAWEAAEGDPASGVKESTRKERRTFTFMEYDPPLYLPFSLTGAMPFSPPEGWRFDLGVLEGCIERDEEWKGRNGFPHQVRRVVRLSEQPGADEWRAAAVERAEQALLALVERETGEVVGFPVRAEGWGLGREPVVVLPERADAGRVLLVDAPEEAWKQAWQVWCQQRNLPAGEAEACQVERAGHRLRVQAPGRLIERLRAARSDALKGEAWLLAGTGRTRATARIDLGEPG